MKKLSFNIFSKYREVIMGIAIISVVLFHYVDDCGIIGINYSGIVKFYGKYIGSSGVDIFLLLSGLGLYYSFSKNSNIKDFYIKRIKRVLVPYFILAIPVYIWYDLIYASDGIIGFLKNLFFVTIFSKDNNIFFWYIFFIILCYLLFPLIYKFIHKGKDWQKIFKTGVLVLLVMTAMYFTCKYNRSFYYGVDIMFQRFVPFILGVLLGDFSYNNKKIGWYILVFVIGLFTCILLNYNLLFSRIILFAFNISIIFFIILIIELLFKGKETITKPLAFFGKYSLEIYLVHVAIRKIIKSYGYPSYKFGYYFLFIIVSIVVSILFNMLIKKVLRIKK